MSAKRNDFADELVKIWGNSWSVNSEIGKLRAVLMRRPGKELENIRDPKAVYTGTSVMIQEPEDMGMLREIFMSEEHREMKKYFLSSLGNIGQIRHFKKGEHIAPDEFRDCFKVVMKGMIKLGLISQNGEYRLFHLMRPGEVYDEYPKFDQDEFEIIAEEDCDVQFFRFNDIRQLRQPEKCLEYLLCSMHRKYSLLKFQALCVQFDDIQGKLVGLILRTAYQCGNMTAEGECMLDYAFTHEEMASIVGCSRVTVTRHLKRLKETGLIDVRHRRIVVKNAEALEKLTAVR